MLLDCWSCPGFGDFKEKWTMPAFVQGFWQSHDLYTSPRGRKCWHPLCLIHLEEELLLSGKDVLAWGPFS